MAPNPKMKQEIPRFEYVPILYVIDSAAAAGNVDETRYLQICQFAVLSHLMDQEWVLHLCPVLNKIPVIKRRG